jgi:hypothetical protein
MAKLQGDIRSSAKSIVKKARVLQVLVVVLTVLFLLQFYFVRELLVLELFFGLSFAVVLLLGGPAYLIGWASVTWLRQPRRNQLKAIPLSQDGCQSSHL